MYQYIISCMYVYQINVLAKRISILGLLNSILANRISMLAIVISILATRINMLAIVISILAIHIDQSLYLLQSTYITLAHDKYNTDVIYSLWLHHRSLRYIYLLRLMD